MNDFNSMIKTRLTAIIVVSIIFVVSMFVLATRANAQEEVYSLSSSTPGIFLNGDHAEGRGFIHNGYERHYSLSADSKYVLSVKSSDVTYKISGYQGTVVTEISDNVYSITTGTKAVIMLTAETNNKHGYFTHVLSYMGTISE